MRTGRCTGFLLVGLLLAAAGWPTDGAADVDQALTMTEESVQGGNAAYAEAQRYMGHTGSAIDQPLAITYLRQAAEFGHVQAQAELAFIYYNGSAHLPKDLKQAFHWFSQAGAAGSAIAQCMLGDFYRTGLGGAPVRPAASVQWYRVTAHSNAHCASRSQYELYRSYASGVGVAQDDALAAHWLQRAAENGNPVAQATLGRLHMAGGIVQRDASKGLYWLRKAREGVAPHDLEPHSHGEEDGHNHGVKDHHH